MWGEAAAQLVLFCDARTFDFSDANFRAQSRRTCSVWVGVQRQTKNG